MKKTTSELSDRLRRRIARLHRRKDREREGRVLVEGIRAVGEAVAAGAPIRAVITGPKLGALQGGAALALALSRLEVESVSLSDAELTALSGLESSQGILVVVDEPRAPELVTLDRGAGIHLVLDGIQDPGNVGALIRSAVAFGFVPVVLPGTADPWSPKAVRASAGTVFRAPPVRANHSEWLGWAETQGVTPWIGDASGSSLPDSSADAALIIGNEGKGASDAMLAAPHLPVAVPHAEGVESLNAAVAGSVLMFALCSRRTEPSGGQADS